MNVKRVHKKRTTKPKRKVVRKRKFVSKFGNPRAMAPSANNYAKTTETITYEDLNPNTMYSALAVLNDTTRALALAKSFQWYRMTAVEWKYKPLYNTFQDQNGTATVSTPSKPQFYMIMNRNGAFQATTLANLEQQGARARDFARDLVVKYKPNTVIQTSISGVNGTPLQANVPELQWNAWLPTTPIGGASPPSDPSLVPYYGHQFYILQDKVSISVDPVIAKLELTITFEFKNPGIQPPAGLPEMKQVKPVL